MVVTSVIELKTGLFAVDQTMAQMMCTLTEGCIEVLREGKLVDKALIYGLSVNYSSMNAMI